jgi:transcriptional regulator with XRE-family HTH domain
VPVLCCIFDKLKSNFGIIKICELYFIVILTMTPNKNFKDFRKSLNLSQVELAEKLQVSQGTITDIERGRISVSKRMIKKISEKLGISESEVRGVLEGKNNEKNNVKIQGDRSGGYSGGVKNEKSEHKAAASYLPKYYETLQTENPDYFEVFKDVMDITNFEYELSEISGSKIGDVVNFGILPKTHTEGFKKFKEIGYQAIKEILPYRHLIHMLAEAVRVFNTGVEQIRDKIGIDDTEIYISDELK